MEGCITFAPHLRRKPQTIAVLLGGYFHKVDIDPLATPKFPHKKSLRIPRSEGKARAHAG
jgi:hypothetical protein